MSAAPWWSLVGNAHRLSTDIAPHTVRVAWNSTDEWLCLSPFLTKLGFVLKGSRMFSILLTLLKTLWRALSQFFRKFSILIYKNVFCGDHQTHGHSVSACTNIIHTCTLKNCMVSSQNYYSVSLKPCLFLITNHCSQ